MRIVLLCALLSGCTPFIRADVGHSFRTGLYYDSRHDEIDETGLVFSGEIGLKRNFNHSNGYCTVRHISFLVNSPEIALNMANCGVEVEFGGRSKK